MTETCEIEYKCLKCGSEGSKTVPMDRGAHLEGYTYCPMCGAKAKAEMVK